MHEKQPEYAPEYSRQEKHRLFLYGLLAILVLVYISQQWLFPWIRWFSDTAPCHQFLGLSGIDWLVYGLFIGIPGVLLLPPSVYLAWKGRKILLQKQFPLKGEKVLKPTRIIRGSAVKIRGYILLLPLAFITLLMLWGFNASNNMIRTFDDQSFDYSLCAATETSGEALIK